MTDLKKILEPSFPALLDFPDLPTFLLLELGFDANCDGELDGTTKAVDFNMPYLPEGTTKEQYFVVCVFESTEADIAKRKAQRAPEWFLPSGPVVPRLLGCPDDTAFSGESGKCEGDGISLYDNYEYEEKQEIEYQAEEF